MRKTEREKEKCRENESIDQSPNSSRVLHVQPRHVSRLHLTVNMADPVEARFDAAVNVVRSMPKKGINQSFHNKNLSTKERLFVFRLVVFS